MPQVEFAKAIHISNGYIADLENNHRRVNGRLIHLISLSFGVSEEWLEEGRGEMFRRTPDEKERRMIDLFSSLPPKFQDYAMSQIEALLKVTGR